MQWMENTFFDHLDKFSTALGYENFGIAFSLATVPWQSTDERDSFISSLTGGEQQSEVK
jgi:hypothetical protein